MILLCHTAYKGDCLSDQEEQELHACLYFTQDVSNRIPTLMQDLHTFFSCGHPKTVILPMDLQCFNP